MSFLKNGILIIAVLILLSPTAKAECWKTSDLSGYSSKQFDSYKIEEGAISFLACWF